MQSARVSSLEHRGGQRRAKDSEREGRGGGEGVQTVQKWYSGLNVFDRLDAWRRVLRVDPVSQALWVSR